VSTTVPRASRCLIRSNASLTAVSGTAESIGIAPP